ncbi:MAG: hypothetical protein JRG67_00660 [Deltaproteobacteria bacterium]|nr:hypothetical protein [Deltaproteobacteria bacterium]MBW2209541.1 hypothetical protein [Deltaproteobacteria bacterium]MBW2381855.1 hypothetical protein [Deltaproteobacteria bacterium]MBW2551113.1 hypothetical protein [Deltaproteobacteria bacterium]MBW2626170.1 hypothetical protein [Deltaproteobacteria bacterium]
MSCKSESAPTGFESPSAAIDSLFRSYGIRDMAQDEARRRLQARERFELLDEQLFQSCFSDWHGEHDHALGGFVFGQLVAGKDELQITVENDNAQVRAASASPELKSIVLVKQNGAWKIDLRQSVPPKVRQSLYEVYRRARRAERQAL